MKGIFKKRNQHRVFHSILPQMQLSDRESSFWWVFCEIRHTQTLQDSFQAFFTIVGPGITTKSTLMIYTLSAAERLALTTYFFPSGDLQTSLSMLFALINQEFQLLIKYGKLSKRNLFLFHQLRKRG